ncbi:phospholipase domain-containing protein [Streptosporangium sp. NPDC000396]|uniref:phospholipase domain-containing protein n=1 Tax=Streptosporangium sp. NPDC000396 TaxID=3366185 RepID=UPI003687C354
MPGGPFTCRSPVTRSTFTQISLKPHNLLRGCHGWYDLTVICPDDPLFSRRLMGHILMGHIEHGAPSISK